MSVRSFQHWKTSFASFASEALKSAEDGDYRRALIECEAILTGKETSGIFASVLSWKPEYGAAVLAGRKILDPMTFDVFVVGLDGWTFTVTTGSHSATCENDPALILAGPVPIAKVKQFLDEVNLLLSVAERKKANDRHASNADGGFQRTPGFLYSKCVEAVATIMKHVPRVPPNCSGFTDVGLHTGCTPRDTALPIVQAVVRATMTNGMIPALDPAPSCYYARFMTEFYLSRARKTGDGVTAENVTKKAVNSVMESLTYVARYGSPLADDKCWPDVMSAVAAECQRIRKSLEHVTSRRAFLDSQRYVVNIPDLEMLEQAPSPTISLHGKLPKASTSLDFQKVLEASKVNLGWVPVNKITTLQHCYELLDNIHFKGNDAYCFSIVFSSIEIYFLNLAKVHLSIDARPSTEITPDLLICVFKKYGDKLTLFRDGGHIGGLMSVELLSHQVLISWLLFCLLYKIGCDNEPFLSLFSVPLDYHDLEHLVLKDKWAWELLDLICSFLQRHRCTWRTVIFSGRREEINGTFALADYYVGLTSKFDALWHKEQAEANARVEKRWGDILLQQKTCKDLRDKISVLESKRSDAVRRRGQEERYVTDTRTRLQRDNPRWLELDQLCDELQSQIVYDNINLRIAQKPPDCLRQPLPKSGLIGKRALFFSYMPKLLRDLWQASYEAQEMLFPDGAPMDGGSCNFHDFFDEPLPYKAKKSSFRTPLVLYIETPPKCFGSKNVENISDREDGVWYPSDFAPTMQWSSGKNPFQARRKDAVECFTEPIADASLKWMSFQYGRETPKDRGNMALAKLNERPPTMTQVQFLTLGNLRANPLCQLFHLLDAIKSRTLPFDESATHTVIRQTLFHIGEIELSDGALVNGALVKTWKRGLYDPDFMAAFRCVLTAVVDNSKEAPKNYQELLLCFEVASFLSQFDPTYENLVNQCSEIAFGWAARIEDEIQKARDEGDGDTIGEMLAKQRAFLLYSLIAFEMAPIADESRTGRIIELITRIHGFRPSQIKGEWDRRAESMMARAYFFMARILPTSQARHFDFTNAVRQVLPSRVENDMKWKCMGNSYCWYSEIKPGDVLSERTKCLNCVELCTSGEVLIINLLNGRILINGAPPSRLPEEIRTHKLFLRAFGDIDFEIVKDSSGSFKLRKPVLERYYSFRRHEADLLVFEEFQSQHGGWERFRLLDHTTIEEWGKGLPVGLKRLYSCWQSESSNTVVLRPIHFRNRWIYYLYHNEGLYKVPQEDLSKPVDHLIEQFSTYDRYLHLDPVVQAKFLGVFTKFDLMAYIHPYVTPEKSFKVLLSRYNIAFELRRGALSYECLDFLDHKLSSVQQLSDVLYGFCNYLILKSSRGEVKIMCPQGPVQTVDETVLIATDCSEIDEISNDPFFVTTFKMHPRLSILQAVDVRSRLQLAAMHAATSSSLPEEKTGMTGFEASVQQLRKSWVNRPLHADEDRMLLSLLEINDLPSVLVILAHGLFQSSRQLSFLFPQVSLKSSLRADQLIDAINEYNLPLQAHLSARNYRLSLTPDEMQSCLGVIKPCNGGFSKCSLGRLAISELQTNRIEDGKQRYQKTQKILYYERRLVELTKTSEDVYVENVKFPLPQTKAIQTQVGQHLITRLIKSYEAFLDLPVPKLRFAKEETLRQCGNMQAQVSSEKELLLNFIHMRVVKDVETRRTWHSDGFLMHRAANGIPILTWTDVVQASFQPEVLKHFNPMLTNADVEELSMIIIDVMQFAVLEDKIARVMQDLQSNKIDLAILELQVNRQYDPYEHPLWLAFEFDQGLQIRPNQLAIIEGILKEDGSVAQLNMGLGKTRVIVPCLLLEWSRHDRPQGIVRVYFLSRLLDEGFDYLHGTLTGGVFMKKLFRLPFSRDVKISLEHAYFLVASIKYCQLVGGAIILAPEHRLSLFLKGFEIENNGDMHLICKKIREIDELPFVDIFDEVDEMMCPNQELIYAQGVPVLLESGSRRWGAIQALLYHVRYHPDLFPIFTSKELAVFDSDCCPDGFNKFRLLPGKRLDENLGFLLREIGTSLFSKKMGITPEGTLSWMHDIESGDLTNRIVRFITDPAVTSNIVIGSEFVKPEHYQDLLALRGLLAHKVFMYCLKLRHDVDYGVVPNHKTQMAIPFRAANLPKLRSEFAQPDCAITLTVLSYYNIGLTRSQLRDCFSTLMRSGPSFQKRVYNECYRLCKHSNRLSEEQLSIVESIDKIDLTNQVQVDMLYRLYRKNMLFINFWLSSVIFPRATMTFPATLMASSWNLTDSRKSKLRCGFSGTDDACILLPHPLTCHNGKDVFLNATNGKMLDHLLNKAVYCSVPAKGHPQEAFEDLLIRFAMEKEVDAFIDAGALFTNLPIEEVALNVLDKLVRCPGKFKGVAYYSSSKCSWRLIDLKLRETSLCTSPIPERDAFVIFDQSRCRGADLKLRPNAKAFLSIGPRHCKDALMQAAGRLRNLDFGQTIVAIASADVESMIRDCVGMKPYDPITMEHVLLYVLYNSIEAIGVGLKHYVGQGLRFIRFLDDSSHIHGEEHCDLAFLYAESVSVTSTSDFFSSKLARFKFGLNSRCSTGSVVLATIKERIDNLGADVYSQSTVNFEECERELEQEREMEQEKEKELSKMDPRPESDWNYLNLLALVSPGNLAGAGVMSVAKFATKHLSNAALSACAIKWDIGKIYLTENFARPLVERGPMDDYLRPVRLLLYFPLVNEILLVSEREAEKICELYLLYSNFEKKMTPVLCGVNFLLTDSTDTHHVPMRSVFCGMVSSPGNIPAASHAALSLFNGSTEFSPSDQDALKKDLVTSCEATDGAKFFCYCRGFRVMYHGSDLEKTCNQICQRLHAIENDESVSARVMKKPRLPLK